MFLLKAFKCWTELPKFYF